MRLRGNAETDKMGNYFPTWAGRNSRRPTSASAPASPREADVVAAHHTTEEYARSCHAGSRSRAPAMSAARIRSFGCWCRMGAVYEVEMPRGIFARVCSSSRVPSLEVLLLLLKPQHFGAQPPELPAQGVDVGGGGLGYRSIRDRRPTSHRDLWSGKIESPWVRRVRERSYRAPPLPPIPRSYDNKNMMILRGTLPVPLAQTAEGAPISSVFWGDRPSRKQIGY